ncbi:MAG: hypothetical protein ABI759_23695 [Candidatus Solibacter sp.]
MLPLGDWWQGSCHAIADSPVEAAGGGGDAQCNLGYARGHCDRFPAGDGADAVRFTISGHERALLRIYYVAERDHHPFAHGALEYSLAGSSLVEPPSSAVLARQAEAYVESYLRRKKEG